MQHMRNTTLFGAPTGATLSHEQQPSQQTPSIRLISAIPSAAGMSSDNSSSFSNSFESSWASVSPSIIAPKPDAPVRKRLVPKKSKLGLLGVGPKDRGKDFLDATQHVRADSSSIRGGFEIYVDPTPDPELGDIVVVKKQKSRGALNEMNWGALGEVTNISDASRNTPSPNAMLKVKEEEKKWWSIGRGRKDSKEKEKERKENPKRAKSPSMPMRSKTPEPLKLNQDGRARFNSLDSGILLNKPANMGFPNPKASSASDPEQPSRFPQPQRSFTPDSLKEACRASSPAPMSSRSATPIPTLGGFLAPPSMAGNAKEQGSIALRAIRSVRSLARMGSWAQAGVNENIAKDVTIKEKKEKKDKKERKDKKDRKHKENQAATVREKKDKKEKSGKKEKKTREDDGTLRHSISSFEAGALTASPAPSKKLSTHTLGKKKSSILGLGLNLPSSMRLRSGSTASSVLQTNHLSVEGFGTSAKKRMGSTISTASSLRPLSMASSSGASASTRESRGSVRWDEEGLQSGKREIQKEKKEKRKKKERDVEEGKGSKRSVEGRRRVAITDIFPEVASTLGQDDMNVDKQEEMQRRFSTAFPIVTIEEATVDGHGDDSEEIRTEDIHDSLVYGGILKEGEKQEEQGELTPVKRQRIRPLSEQMLGKARPRAVYEDEEGVLSILDAATNDLAQLINNLDLEATPTTPDLTPLRPSPLPTNVLSSVRSGPEHDGSPLKRARFGNDSPLKNKSPSTVRDTPRGLGLRSSTASITSLRPYAQSRGQATRTLATPVFVSNPVNDATIKKKPSEAGIGQQIAPWSVLLQQLSPVKERRIVKESDKENDATTDSPLRTGTWKKGHKRSMTPGPEPEPAPVFQPLRPPKVHTMKIPDAFDGKGTLKPSASSIFVASADPSKPSTTKGSVSPPASLARRASAFLRKRCSLLPIPADASTGDLSFACAGDPSFSGSGANFNNFASSPSGGTSTSDPGEKRRRMPATLGGSDVSCYAVPELDASDPDSDIPDELQFILKTNSDRGDDDDTFEFNKGFGRAPDDSDEVEHPRSLPPLEFSPMPSETMDVSVFGTSLTGDDSIGIGIDDSEHLDAESDTEADTKKSFDFTGELRKLNESGASDRRSFVEQLERAFRTPAKVDLRYDVGRLLRVEVPPVPSLPVDLDLGGARSKVTLRAPRRSTGGVSSVERSILLKARLQQEQKVTVEQEDVEPDAFDIYEVSRLVDVKEPNFFNMQSTKCEESIAAKDSTSRINFDSVSRLADAQQPTDIFNFSFEGGSADGPDRVIVSADPSEVLDTPFSSSAPSRSCLSNGELNTSFKFGGIRRQETSEHPQELEKPLTLSDIIPPPSHVRSLSSSSSPSRLEDDSLFQSILAKVSDGPQPRPRVASDASDKFLQVRNSTYRHSQASSIASFTGFDSFEEIRRGFEFNLHRPAFYPPSVPNNHRNNRVRDSVMSIASVSSYGRLINPGHPDPFDFGLPSLQERPSSENLSTMSFSIDDTFSFLNHASRRRVDSDASSFYFRAPNPHSNHRRHESNSSQAPPVSLYNRSAGAHRRNDSGASVGSRSAWRSSHRFNASVDSIMSDFSAMRLGRPGLGDKMFEMADQTMPLASISASPPDSSASGSFSAQMAQHSTYDSIMDDDRRPSLDASDSILDKTGHRTSILSDYSVFGYDDDSRIQPGLLPPHQFRPLSMTSMSSVHNPTRDDDTMITMLGGGHVRRCSMGSTIEASPCVRAEKRKFQTHKGGYSDYESPNKARIVERPSIAALFQVGSDRVIQSQHGQTEKHDPEDSYFVGHGEDVSVSFRPVPVFTRPPPASRSRSSTCTSSSGGDTPPLSASDGSSVSGSSMSSIDLREIDAMLANSSFPTSTLQHARARARARGHGHRRRYSHIRSSRSNSVYETIEEEAPSALTSPAHSLNTEKMSSPTQPQPIFIVDSDTDSIHSNIEESMTWDDERGIVALRRYYALHDEVQSAVTESKRLWSDTPFSLFAVQSFQPPHHPEGMKALLEHSVKTYGPLPSELRPRRMRSRKNSRPSPYPQNRPSKVVNSPNAAHSPRATNESVRRPFAAPIFEQALMNKNTNVPLVPSLLDSTKPTPFLLNVEKNQTELKSGNLDGTIRPRVGSNARRTAFGWSKRSTGHKGSTGPGAGGKLSTGANTMSTKQKENVVGTGNGVTSGDNLRINRPRPKGRTTPSSTTKKAQRPIRV